MSRRNTTGSAALRPRWVLWIWRQDERLRLAEWDNDSVYPTYSKCWARIRQHTGVSEKGALTDWYDWVRGLGRYNKRTYPGDISRMKPGDRYVGVRETGGVAVIDQHTVTVFRCLPDTLDPRGPIAQ